MTSVPPATGTSSATSGSSGVPPATCPTTSCAEFEDFADGYHDLHQGTATRRCKRRKEVSLDFVTELCHSPTDEHSMCLRHIDHRSMQHASGHTELVVGRFFGACSRLFVHHGMVLGALTAPLDPGCVIGCSARIRG